MTLSKGDQFPKGVSFVRCPFDADVAKGGSCPAPMPFSLDQYLGKKFLLVAAPGAFTPTCSEKQIPYFVKHAKELRKSVDAIIIITANDPFVQFGWANALNGYNEDIIFASDLDAKFSQQIGFTADLSSKGFGLRTGRYALIVDKGVVTYVGNEEDPGVTTVSSYDAVAKAL